MSASAVRIAYGTTLVSTALEDVAKHYQTTDAGDYLSTDFGPCLTQDICYGLARAILTATGTQTNRIDGAAILLGYGVILNTAVLRELRAQGACGSLATAVAQATHNVEVDDPATFVLFRPPPETDFSRPPGETEFVRFL